MSVYKRNGHWHFTKTINGKRYRGALKTARTKAQAEEAERAELRKIHDGTYGRPTGSAIFIEFAEKVYLPWSEENKRSDSDRYHIEVFKSFFKRKTFAEISPMLIEKFKSERRKSLTQYGSIRKPASVNREIACLSAIFSMAMRKPHCLVSENPCREVVKLNEDNKRHRYLSIEEERALLSTCVGNRGHIRSIIIIAVNTGMRRGEILSLIWANVDLSKGIIHLMKTKSGKGRDIPISGVVRGELLALKAKGKGDFVFTNHKTGRALTHFKRAFLEACRLAGISDFHFHDLRHTAATRMAEAGVEPAAIKEILGHADYRMMDRYTHVAEVRKREAVERLANYGREAEVVSLGSRKRLGK